MTRRRLATFAFLILGFSACRGTQTESPAVIRLVDIFDGKDVEGSPGKTKAISATEWRFDGDPPATAPKSFAATRGWGSGPEVAEMALRDGLLTGRAKEDFPIIHVERTTGLDNPDQLHAIEVRLRVTSGANMSLLTSAAETLDLAEIRQRARTNPWRMTTPVVAGPQLQTYILTTPSPLQMARIRHLLIRPTDAAGANFAIDSVRMVTRKEHLTTIPSGIGWQGLRDVYRESIVARSPEKIRFRLSLPRRARLDLSLGTIEDMPVTFRLNVTPDGTEEAGALLLEQTVTTPYRWEARSIDLAPFAGQSVRISLSLAAEQPGALGFWGGPVVRSPGTMPPATARAANNSGNASSRRPQGVILIQADTLRRDALDAYGYGRDTAPTVRRMASEGTLFKNAYAQATWTKVSTPSILSSLYPTTHGVHRVADRLPASATTIAEAYRAAGYATLSLSSTSFTGLSNNLHQGFEELHEDGSLATRGSSYSSKTSREHVDRLLEWLEEHREDPFFVFLHVFDPHSPYEPRSPYNQLWADASAKEVHQRQVEAVRKFIAAPGFRSQGMATREEMVRAGLNPEEFIGRVRGWYDGSIRGLDGEMARILERLNSVGLSEKTLIVFLSDHGEEFHDHGRMWHGHSVYNELTAVPLILWWPGAVGRGVVVEEPVELIDVMPTLLEVSGISPPEGMQGTSLRALLTSGGPTTGRRRRPAISERPVPEAMEQDPEVSESYALVDDNWKLIHNRSRKPNQPEYELYDLRKDPREQSDLAAQQPEMVARLAKMLEGWRKMAVSAKLKPDSESTKGLSAEQLQRLRSLGYVK